MDLNMTTDAEKVDGPTHWLRRDLMVSYPGTAANEQVYVCKMPRGEV